MTARGPSGAAAPTRPSSRRGEPSALLTRDAEPEFLYLTTTGRRTGLPREIEIWFTALDDRFYVIAEHGERAAWVRNVGANPRVGVRVGRQRFTARARVLDAPADAERRREVRARSETKYGWGDGLVVELTPDATPPSGAASPS